MLRMNETPDPEIKAEQLARLAQILDVEIAPEELAALSNQLHLLDDLEQSKLHDHLPILKMDADWYD